MTLRGEARRLGEMARRVARGLMPAAPYRQLATLYGWQVSMCRLGIRESRRLRYVARAAPEPRAEAFFVPELPHPVWVRRGTTDAYVFASSLVRRCYACHKPDKPISLVVDAGANVGYASLFFLNEYPSATVIALEPDPSNCDLARKNLASYGSRAIVLQAAVWPVKRWLRLQKEGREDGVRVIPSPADEGTGCLGIDPLSLLQEGGYERLDLFKCDIEGAEEQLFAEGCDPWIDRTDSIVVEIHTSAAHEAIFRAMRRHPFRHSRYRELHVFARKGA